jgi:hypothetical protein
VLNGILKQVTETVELVPLTGAGQGVIELRITRTIPPISSRLKGALISVLKLLYPPRLEAVNFNVERLNV